MMLRRLIAALGLGLVLCAPALAADKTRYSIWWVSDPVPLASWGAPVPATYLPCWVRGVRVSICPYRGYLWTDPWDMGAQITVVGVSIAQTFSDPKVIGQAILGSASGTPAADVIVQTSGPSGSVNSKEFRPGTGLPQGGPPGSAWFDIYAHGWGGDPNATQQITVIIDYVCAVVDPARYCF